MTVFRKRIAVYLSRGITCFYTCSMPRTNIFNILPKFPTGHFSFLSLFLAPPKYLNTKSIQENRKEYDYDTEQTKLSKGNGEKSPIGNYDFPPTTYPDPPSPLLLRPLQQLRTGISVGILFHHCLLL